MMKKKGQDETKLRKEIAYLTRLIEAHKAIKTLQSNGTTLATVTTTRGTLRRIRSGSAVPSWSNSGSISCHLPSCKPSSVPCKSTYYNNTVEVQNSASQNDGHQNEESQNKGHNSLGVKRTISSRDLNVHEGKSKKIKVDYSRKNSAYSWKPGVHNTVSTCSSRFNNGESRSRLKWRKDEVDLRTVAVDTTCTTISYKTISMASKVSKKRRRSSSSSSDLFGRKHKMFRSSLDSIPSFSERRLQYFYDQSSHSHFNKIKRKRLYRSVVRGKTQNLKSRNRIWIPKEEKNTSTFCGYETKTKQGNKQWMSEAAAAVRKNSKKHLLKKNDAQVVNVFGAQYVMAYSGRSLQRVPVNQSGTIHVSRKKKRHLSSSSSIHLSAKRQLANHIVKKSFNRVWSAKSVSSANRYCLFYNRFGRCNRGETCKFEHDPKRVAVCNKFLRGVCDKVDGTCPFSHNVSKEKMPVCSFFLRGLCTRVNCPYLHVSVGQDAELCLDFVRGFCSLGERCDKLHVLECPEFVKNGLCPRGKQCPLIHKKKRIRTKSNLFHNEMSSTINETETAGSSVPSIKEPYFFKKVRNNLGKKQKTNLITKLTSPTQVITPAQLEFIPLDTDEVPEFIAL